MAGLLALVRKTSTGRLTPDPAWDADIDAYALHNPADGALLNAGRARRPVFHEGGCGYRLERWVVFRPCINVTSVGHAQGLMIASNGSDDVVSAVSPEIRVTDRYGNVVTSAYCARKGIPPHTALACLTKTTDGPIACGGPATANVTVLWGDFGLKRLDPASDFVEC